MSNVTGFLVEVSWTYQVWLILVLLENLFRLSLSTSAGFPKGPGPRDLEKKGREHFWTGDRDPIRIGCEMIH